MKKLHEVRIMTPKQVSALEVHRARARSKVVRTLLDNIHLDDVTREMLEEEELQLEMILLSQKGGH